MAEFPLVYISNTQIQGSHGDGWQRDLAPSEGLPGVETLLQALPEAAFSSPKLGLVIDDSLMYPLRVTLEEKLGTKDREQYLLWKLKRLLPYPIEQVQMRHIPMGQELTYLTYSLPTPWVNALYQGLKSRSVRAGYMGALLGTLLENSRRYQGGVVLALLREFYLLVEPLAGGSYQGFRTRRLPLDADGALDVNVLADNDLQPLLQPDDSRALHLLPLAPEHDGPIAGLAEILSTRHGGQVIAPALEGGLLQRFMACREGGSA